MKQRQIDLALLAGIGVLLLVILILALSAAPLSNAGDISDPVERVGSSPARAETPLPATEPVAQPDTQLPQPAAVPETETGTAPAVSTPAAGLVRLERIGFAYATGAAGACGVPLSAWNFIAVSRDLLARYPCGTAVTLTLNDEIAGRREVTAQVGDTMGAEITDTVNIFVAEDEPALEYGVTSGTLSP